MTLADRKPESLKSLEREGAGGSALEYAEWVAEKRIAAEREERQAREDELKRNRHKLANEEFRQEMQRRKENYAKISALRGRISDLQRANINLRSTASQRRYSMNSGNTRTSSVDQAKILAEYHEKIDANLRTITTLRAEIARLEAQ